MERLLVKLIFFLVVILKYVFWKYIIISLSFLVWNSKAFIFLILKFEDNAGFIIHLGMTGTIHLSEKSNQNSLFGKVIDEMKAA